MELMEQHEFGCCRELSSRVSQILVAAFDVKLNRSSLESTQNKQQRQVRQDTITRRRKEQSGEFHDYILGVVYSTFVWKRAGDDGTPLP